MTTASSARPATERAGRRRPPSRASRWSRAAWTLARRRPVLTAAGIYALLSLAFVSPAFASGKTLSASDLLWAASPWTAARPAGVRLLGSNFSQWDAATVFQPWLEYTRSLLPHIPLWNPYVMGGRPFVANPQAAVFSPFSLPAYVLGVYPALAFIAALKLFVASLGTFLLARALGMRFAASLLAGILFAFNLYFVVLLTWPHTSVWAFIPWLLVATERVVRRPDRLRVAALGLLVALSLLGGHPESSFIALFATVAFFVWRMAAKQSRPAAGTRRRTVGMFGAGLVWGGGLAALMLVPLAELSLHSSDVHFRSGLDTAAKSSDLLGSLLPNYWGRPTNAVLDGSVIFAAHRPVYVGATALAFAMTALVARPQAARLAVAAFGLFCGAVQFGVPGISDLIRKLPGFSFVNTGYFAVLVAMCLALLAAWGFDDLLESRVPRTRARYLRVALVVLLVLPAFFVAIPSLSLWHRAAGVALTTTNALSLHAHLEDVVRFASLLLWLAFAGATLLLVLGRLSARPRLRTSAFIGLTLVVVTVDLFRAGVGQNPAISLATARQPVTGAIRYLQTRRPTRFAGLGPVMPGAMALRYGLYDARGKDYPIERHYDAFWSRISPLVASSQAAQQRLLLPLPPPINAGDRRRLRERLRGLSLLSVTDVLEDPHKGPPVPGMKLAYDGADAAVYSNPFAVPRAFVVERQWVRSGDEAALNGVFAPAFNPQRAAVTQRRIPGIPVGGPAGSSAPGGIAKLVTYRPEHVSIVAATPRPGLLVLTDVAYPGWQARVDGHSAPIERVDYLFRGVRLGAGRHTVEFDYRPASWRIGWIVTLLAALGLEAAVFTAIRSRRRRA